MLGVEHYAQVATEPLPPGELTVRMQFDADEVKPGTGGTVSLYAGDAKVGEGRLDRTVPIAFSSYAGMDVGRDNGLVVDAAYKDRAPYAFTGTVKKVVFDLKPGHIDDERALHETAAQGAAAHGIGA
jgi:arylsulfatase